MSLLLNAYWAAFLFHIKPSLNLNANRMWMRHAKTKQMFDVDVLLRRGQQPLAVRRTLGLYLNANRTWMRHAKKKQMFDVDVLSRRG